MRCAKRTFVVIAFTLVSCSSQVVPASTPTSHTAMLQLRATTSTDTLAADLTRQYTQLNPAIGFDLQTSNYAGVLDSIQATPAFVLTNHLPAESPLWAAPIAQDAIAIITHPTSGISGLQTEQLRSIYQGRVVNWRDLGGPDASITVFSRESGSGIREEFERQLMGERSTIQSAFIAPSSAAMVTSVAETPYSIGYVSPAKIRDGVVTLRLDDYLPTPDDVYDSLYPLRSTLFIAGQTEPEGDYRGFIGWVQSPAGQQVVARHYTPLVWP